MRITPDHRLAPALRGYRRGWLADDAMAALVLTALLIPAGMGYAQACGLPAVTGLYATITSLVVYAVFGPSRILVYGPDSSLVALIAAAVLPLGGGDPARTVALAGMLAIISGAMCVLAGLARFGFLADLLSAPVRVGYLNGIAVSVTARQLPHLLGFEGEGDNPVSMLLHAARQIFGGAIRGWPALIGLSCLAVLVLTRRLTPRVPATLLAVAVPTVLLSVIDAGPDTVTTIGEIPRGLPSVSWASLGVGDLSSLMVAALGISFVAFADTSVLSRSVALRRHEHVDPNRELLALGAVNVACGLSGGFAVSSSATRTPVAESAGSHGQFTGLFAAVMVGVVLVAAPGLLHNVPEAALAAVVIAAAGSLVELRQPRRWARIRRNEFLLCVASFLAIVGLGVIAGIAVSIIIALAQFMHRAWRPHTAELVRVDGLKGYHEAHRHPEGHAVPGLLLYRFDAPLFFANAAFFVEDVLARIDANTRQVTVTAEPITDFDATAAETFVTLLDELDRRGIVFTFAELKGRVRDQVAAYGLLERIGAENFARTVGEAVRAYVTTNRVSWQDWEDRAGDA